MYLAEVFAENFRIFGSESEHKELRFVLQPGLNVLVGENDGGKSAIIDAIRYCLWTTSQDYHRFTTDDFHCNEHGRVKSLRIRCKFEQLSTDDQATFMEWLTTPEAGEPVLYVHVRATRMEGKRQERIWLEPRSGETGEGPAVEGIMREFLKTTYLRPLRDAEAELSSGRNSRLSQILSNHPDIANQRLNDFQPDEDGSGKTLVGIMKRAEHEIGLNEAIQAANTNINHRYLHNFQMGLEPLLSEVGVVGDTTLGRILEKLELVIAKPSNCLERTRRGLGYNNALFMSAELLLLGKCETYPTLLIEEPEAHLHPQMQTSVVALLKQTTKSIPVTDQTTNQNDNEQRPVQVLMTTHSPNIASSIPLEQISIVSAGRTFSLAPQTTMLVQSDYAFLERFLDVTKANLFFARGVAIVEGDAENILVPALAEKIGLSFRKYGISVVNVGHTGLFRFSNIFRRQDCVALPIKIACLRDRDIAPDHASDELRKGLKKESELDSGQHEARITQFKRDGGSVKTFVSDQWTFEYDLAAASWEMAKVIHGSIKCASMAATMWPDDNNATKINQAACDEIEAWREDGKLLDEIATDIYTPLRLGKASKSIAAPLAAKFLADSSIESSDLPKYLQEAFTYLTGGSDDAIADQ